MLEVQEVVQSKEEAEQEEEQEVVQQEEVQAARAEQEEVARKSNRGRRGRRGGRRCDIRCKVNISLLTNMNLLRDDLADVAYFVRELREAEL